ncbi:hypothetical protein SMD44_p10030 (plasmid) [Streptomyces alboflavus]|uniref:Uncharacterized protein n=1 Tax=Streptomyces alboflavus TaxID=67267 RepID=A0A291W4M0_9ACTN|nr:hypothetical protein [Streptomyces alboflavus]ATM24529.1 hypothetical protein SMD44_p10030 [Streptomyces alboflavus]
MSSPLLLPPMPRTLEPGDRLTLRATTYTRDDSGSWASERGQPFGTDDDVRDAYRSRASLASAGAPFLAPAPVPYRSALPGTTLRPGDWVLAERVTYLWCTADGEGRLLGTAGLVGPWGPAQRHLECRLLPTADTLHAWSVTPSGRWFVRRGRILRAYLPVDMPDADTGLIPPQPIVTP